MKSKLSRKIASLWAVALSASIVTASASATSYDYEEVEGGIRLTGVSGTQPSGELVIPATYDGKKVVIVGSEDDAGCKHGIFSDSSVTQVVVSDGIEELSYNVFYGCSTLSSIQLPSSLKVIRAGCFGGCTALNAITLPEGLTTLERDWLKSESGVTSLKLPSTLVDIEEGALAIGTIRTYTVAEGNARYRVENGYVYDYVDDVVFMRADTTKTKFVIPDGAKRIAECCFAVCNKGDITIPASVEELGPWVFCECAGVTVRFLGSEPDVDDTWPHGELEADHLFEGSTGVKVYVLPGQGWDDICAGGTWQGQPIAMKVSVAVTAGEGGTATGGGTYDVGAKISLNAKPAKGYVFAGWYTDSGFTCPDLSLNADWRSASQKLTASASTPNQLFAKFITPAEDSAAVSCEVDPEYVTKQAIDPIAIDVSGCSSLPTVKVAGLPAGLKFTAKQVLDKSKNVIAEANTIYGTPTKSGIYTTTITATTAGKKSAVIKKTFTVLDRSLGEKILSIDYDADAGKATGSGVYAAGKTVNLKATPAKGYVFAGWYSDAGFTTPLSGTVDYRTASFAYTMPDADTTVYAKFVAAGSDTEMVLKIEGETISDDPSDTVFNTAGETTLALDVESESLPKLAVSGLPAGLKYTAKQVLNKDKSVLAEANTIYGTATKPGVYTVTVKLTNTTVKKAIVKKFTIVVDNLKGANDDIACENANGEVVSLANDRGDKYTICAGVTQLDMPNKITSATGSVKISGLPSGLKYNAKTGKITGVATKAGTYTVYITVNKKVSTFTVVVNPLPGWVLGTFVCYGYVDGVSRDVWTVAADGKISCKTTAPDDERLDAYTSNDLRLSRFDAEDGMFYIDWEGFDGDDEKSTFGGRIEQSIINGIVRGTMSACEQWYEDDGETVAGSCWYSGYQDVWKKYADDVCMPKFAAGATKTIPLDDYAEKFTATDYGGECHLEDCSLVLKFGANGAVTVTFVDDGVKTATGSAVLTPYEYNGVNVVKAYLTVALAPKGRHSMCMVLYMNVNVSSSPASGDDVTVFDHLLESKAY